MRLDEDGNAYKVDFVSIHASVKDATLWDYCIPFEGNVSIHASVKDATFWALVLVAHLFCFNPRICKRCDGLGRVKAVVNVVSIHASEKDATDSVLPKWLTYRVSIHASVKDATITM